MKLPTVGSVWRKGDEWRRVSDINEAATLPILVSRFGSDDVISLDEWYDWSRDAEWMNPPGQKQPSPAEPPAGTVRVVPAETNDGGK